MDTKNKEKCQGRRNAIAVATPVWITSEQSAQIKEMYSTCKELNKLGKDKYHVDHIAPLSHPLSCGLHVPWNLQILNEKDNKEKGNKVEIEPRKGAITVENLGGSLRYKGQFLKGTSGNPAGRPATASKANDDVDPEFQMFMDGMNSETKDPSSLIEDMSLWMIRNARSREEAYRYMKDFAPYFKPKLSNIETAEITDNKFVVEVIRPQKGGGIDGDKQEGVRPD